MKNTTEPRDLVALAAKAIGHTMPEAYFHFQPLDDAGTALNVACRLSMTIDYTSDSNGDYVVTRARGNGEHYCCVQPYTPKTKLSMTMYAITYVAASIGEDMP